MRETVGGGILGSRQRVECGVFSTAFGQAKILRSLLASRAWESGPDKFGTRSPRRSARGDRRPSRQRLGLRPALWRF